VYEFYKENRDEGKLFTWLYFKKKKLSKSTVYGIIKRVEKDRGPERVSGSGRIAKKMTKKNIGSLKLMFENNDKVSQYQASKRFDCNQAYISKTLKKHTEIKRYTKNRFRKELMSRLIKFEQFARGSAKFLGFPNLSLMKSPIPPYRIAPSELMVHFIQVTCLNAHLKLNIGKKKSLRKKY